MENFDYDLRSIQEARDLARRGKRQQRRWLDIPVSR